MIAIKGMENIPTSCVECSLKSGGYCYHKKPPYNLSEFEFLNERPKDCPLVEIVTCKDCKNYVKGALDEEICLRGHELIHENFYCADGERRE